MPFVLFLLGAAAVGLVAATASAKSKKGGGGGRTYTLDTNLPPQLRQQVLAALATEKDPMRLLSFAAQCAAGGYPLAAAALTQRAVELGGVPPQPFPQPQPGPQPGPQPVNPVDPGLLPDPPRTQVLAALSTGTDPDALEALAQQMDAQGYTYAAQALRMKESLLRGMTPPSPAPWPTPQPQPQPQPIPVQPQPAPIPSPFSLDPGMPPAMQSAVLGALTTEQDPNKLQAFAQEIQSQYPISAGLLMAKANALRMQPSPFPPPQPGPGPGPMPVPQGVTAIVTTRDPPPLGDLKVFDRPNGTQIGGVDKSGTVAVLQWNVDGANQWARVAWAGGARWKAVTGYVHQAYLSPVAAQPAPAGSPSAALAVRKGGSNGLATTHT